MSILIHPSVLTILNKYLDTLDILCLTQTNRWTYSVWVHKQCFHVCFQMEKRIPNRYRLCDGCLLFQLREYMLQSVDGRMCILCSDYCSIWAKRPVHRMCAKCFVKEKKLVEWKTINGVWKAVHHLNYNNNNFIISTNTWSVFWQEIFAKIGKETLTSWVKEGLRFEYTTITKDQFVEGLKKHMSEFNITWLLNKLF